jgi:hypothetical protein
MNTYLRLALASSLFAFVSLAAQANSEAKTSDAKPEKAACGCVTGADKKVCGVDKACCCTGEKAKGKDEAKKAD